MINECCSRTKPLIHELAEITEQKGDECTIVDVKEIGCLHLQLV